MGRYQGQFSAECTGRTLKAAKGMKQQERPLKPNLQKEHRSDVNQRTMQALNDLAIVYAPHEQDGANLEFEITEGHLLFADVRTAMEELTAAQQNQGRLQGELKNSRKVSTLPSWTCKSPLKT